MSDAILSPDQLRSLTQKKEMAELKKLLAIKKKREHEAEQAKQMFMTRDLRPDWRERLNQRIRIAAEQGQSEIMVFSFPSSFCTDGGRAINNFDDSWPETLTGFAKVAHETYEAHLKAQGFKIRAEVLNFPGGIPGDVGFYLGW